MNRPTYPDLSHHPDPFGWYRIHVGTFLVARLAELDMLRRAP